MSHVRAIRNFSWQIARAHINIISANETETDSRVTEPNEQVSLAPPLNPSPTNRQAEADKMHCLSDLMSTILALWYAQNSIIDEGRKSAMFTPLVACLSQDKEGGDPEEVTIFREYIYDLSAKITVFFNTWLESSDDGPRTM